MLTITIIQSVVILVAVCALIVSRRPVKVKTTRLHAIPGYTPEWSPELCNAWATVLRSEVGKVVLARARYLEACNAVNGSKDVFNTIHSAGRSAGFSDAINWLESLANVQMLSRTPGDQGETTEPGQQTQTDPSEFRRAF